MPPKESVASPVKRLPWQIALSSFNEYFQLGPDGIGLFALGLSFEIDDVISTAADVLTGGGDDKKCDMLWVDIDSGVVVMAQCYQSTKLKPAAPSNKAPILEQQQLGYSRDQSMNFRLA